MPILLVSTIDNIVFRHTTKVFTKACNATAEVNWFNKFQRFKK